MLRNAVASILRDYTSESKLRKTEPRYFGVILLLSNKLRRVHFIHIPFLANKQLDLGGEMVKVWKFTRESEGFHLEWRAKTRQAAKFFHLQTNSGGSSCGITGPGGKVDQIADGDELAKDLECRASEWELTQIQEAEEGDVDYLWQVINYES